MNELVRLLRSAAETVEPFTRQIRANTLVWNGEKYAVPTKLQEPDTGAVEWFVRLSTAADLVERGDTVTDSQLAYLQDFFRGSMGTLADFNLDPRRWGKAAEEANYKLHRIADEGLEHLVEILRSRQQQV